MEDTSENPTLGTGGGIAVQEGGPVFHLQNTLLKMFTKMDMVATRS